MAEQQAASKRIVVALLLFSLSVLFLPGCRTSSKPAGAAVHGALAMAPLPAKPTFLSQPDPLIINVGNQANDNTGDSIRTALQKVNTNVVTLFNLVTNISNASAYSKSLLPKVSSVDWVSALNLGAESDFTKQAKTNDTALGWLSALSLGPESPFTEGIKARTDAPGWRDAIGINSNIVFGSTGIGLPANTSLSIGTTNPLGPLHFSSDAVFSNYGDVYSNDPSQRAAYLDRRARGTHLSPLPVQDGDWLGSYDFEGYATNGFNHKSAYVSAFVDGTPTSPDYVPGRFSWFTSDGTQDPVENLRLGGNGNLGVISGAMSTLGYTVFIGDSFTYGVGASIPANDYVNVASRTLGWGSLNLGASGAQVADKAPDVYGQTPTVGKNYVWYLGVNDARNYTNANQAPIYSSGMLAEVAWLAMLPSTNKLTARGAGISTSGTWANTGVYGIGLVSTNNGSTMTASVYGKNVLVGYIAQDGTGGQFSLTVDGVNCGTWNNYEAGTINTILGVGYIPHLAVVPNLTDTLHTVVVTVTSPSNPNNLCYIDWIAGTGSPNQKNGPNVYVLSIPRMTATAYATYGGNDANVARFNQILQYNCSFLASMGMNVTLGDVAGAINPYVDLGGDGVHPNDGGHAKIAAILAEIANGVTYPRDRQGAAGIPNVRWSPNRIGWWTEQSGWAERAALTNGNFGIGTPNPTERLEVKDSNTFFVRPNQSAVEEIPAGVLVGTKGGNIALTSDAINGAAGSKLALLYVSGGTWYSALEFTNIVAGVGALYLMKSGGLVDVGGGQRIRGSASISSGSSIDLNFTGSDAYIDAYNHDSSAFLPMHVRASSLDLPEPVHIGTAGTATETLEVQNVNTFAVTPNQGAAGELPAGVLLATKGTNLCLVADRVTGAPGAKVAVLYYSGGALLSALEIANIASGHGNLSMMKSGGSVTIGTNTLRGSESLRANGDIVSEGVYRVGANVGLTTNVNVLVAGGTTNQLQFVGGILKGVVPQ